MLRHNRSKNINQHKHKKGNARLGKQTESKLRVDLRFGFTTEEEGKQEKREESRLAGLTKAQIDAKQFFSQPEKCRTSSATHLFCNKPWGRK